jgi:hypothetical protein
MPWGRQADTAFVSTYRLTPRWVVHLFAAVTLAAELAGFASIESRLEGVAEWGGVVLLLGAGLAIPLVALLWNRSVGVHVSDAGIVSVGLNDVDAVRWREIDRFFVDDLGPNRFAVYAGLTNGTRLLLYGLKGKRWQRPQIERVCDALSAKLHYERERSRDPSATPSFAGVPFGWRRRVRSVAVRA